MTLSWWGRVARVPAKGCTFSRAMADQFGPYRVVRKIATGGMAEVYLARHRGPEGVERTVVVKRILPNYTHDEEFVTMFRLAPTE